MQDDEKKKIEDDIIEDTDFDLDDFDDDDLADDESWDDFDDDAAVEDAVTIEDEAVDVDSEPVDADPAAPVPKKKKKKKSSMMNVAIIGVVLLGGGGFALTQMGGSGPKPAAAPAQVPGADKASAQFDEAAPASDVAAMEDIPELSSDTGLPPMPTPINTDIDETLDISVLPEMDDTDNAAKEMDPAIEDALIPMPGADEMSDTILSELNIDEVPTVPVTDAALESADTNIMEFDSVMMDEPKDVIEDTISVEPKLMDSEPDEFLIDESSSITPEPVHNMQKSVEMAMPEPSSTKTMAAPSNEVSKKVAALEQKISHENMDLSKKINETNNRLETLVDSISALEKRLDTLGSMPSKPKVQAAPTPQKAPPPKPEVKKPVKNQSFKQKMTEKPKPVAKTSTKWQLRAAQPGKALVAAQGSNDMVTVHIGDSLPGIGRITDITSEDGKWVIRGTEGLITQ